MCGIVGWLSRGEPLASGLIETMRDTLAHRGPDGAGAWVGEGGRVALGHRRLAILDLTEGGYQPMAGSDGRHHLTYNGEIYNFAELKDELAALGHSFHTRSDSEVLLAAYARWGEDCVRHFDGMFAFAIWDSATRTLFAARDRAGEKPFFYHHSAGAFGFASELKALFANPALDRRLNLAALDQYLAYGYVPRGQCLVDGFAKLPAAHRLRYSLDTGALAIEPYWALPRWTGGTETPLDALADEFEPLLDRAVSRQLVADVPVGILLSGGLDSSLIAATAARHSSRVTTFTIGFPDSARHDESPIARRLAGELGTNHVELMAEGDTVALLPELVAQFDEPLNDSSMIPMLLLSRLVRTRATVALGGDGGDELFGGYAPYEWLERVERARGYAPASHALQQLAGAMMPARLPRRKAAFRLLDHWDAAITNGRLNAPSERRALAPALRGLPRADGPEAMRAALVEGRSDMRERAMACDFQAYMCDDILVKVDRASMLASLEVRAPLLDRSIIEFAFGRLSPDQRVGGGERKRLLRRVAKRRLPGWFDNARKQGFSIPLAQWLRGPWAPLIRDLGESRDGGLLDARAVRRVLGAGGVRDNLAGEVYQVAMLELWRRHYRIGLA